MSDDEVFFIDSSVGENSENDSERDRSDNDDDDDGKRHASAREAPRPPLSSQQRAATTAAVARSGGDGCVDRRLTSSPPTMEDVLFGLGPPKRWPASSPPPPPSSTPASPSPASHNGLSGEGALSTGAASVSATATPPRAEAPGETQSQPYPFAGGSPLAMPAKQTPPPLRTLAELRGMTSSDVREQLERFFLRKDAHAKRFKGVEAELSHTTNSTTDSSVKAAAITGTSQLSNAELLARDRCRRLVNVSNWDSAVNGYSQWDVLLPSNLLPDVPLCDAPPATPAPTTAAPSPSPSAAVRRRTLRPHQVEGIRFLWSVLAEGPVGQVPAVGCILAHTMGLGKTGQVVVFLHLFMEAFQRRRDVRAVGSGLGAGDLFGGIGSPAGSSAESPEKAPSLSTASQFRRPRVLIVIPKSTQSGWKREFHTWSLSFPAEYRLHPLVLEESMRPHQRTDLFHQWRREGGVMLVGYEALVRLLQLVEEESVLQGREQHLQQQEHRASGPAPGAADSLSAREQHRRDLRERRTDEGGKAYGGEADPFTELVICDEAHRLKSVHLHIVQALRGLHPLRRMLLTGTPLQNHLHEYWAMMDFCVHKYFSRKRFREYFIQPIESSAHTRASEREVDLARKKTFTLINEVRHFVQRVDSAPLRHELPPLHEYIVVIPPSPLQKELYLRFVTIVMHDGSQKLQFLPAVSYSGKIAAHPQLLFQMRDRLAAEEADAKGRGRGARKGGGGAVGRKRAGDDYWGLEQKQKERAVAQRGSNTTQQQQQSPAPQRLRREAEVKPRMSSGAEEDATSSETDAVVISDSSSSSPGSDRDEDVAVAKEEEAFMRVTQQSFSALHQAPLTYEELCIPPSSNYVPRLEDGTKLLVAMKLIAAAMGQQEKVLLFSLSTQLLSFFERMIAAVNVEWCRQPDGAAAPLLQRPIRYCRLDGSHSAAQRAAMLDDFDRADGPDLFLLSMKAGGVGVTITAATRVILVDTSFNPADDQQAIGRAYRYGQTRPVYVYRLMCYPTLEYSIFVQKLAKEWLFKTVVEESSVKRDGLSGMHLRELFTLLATAARVLEKPPAATRAQNNSTDEVLRADPMLSAVRPELLYAQRYEMFLERDQDDRYGAAEEEFYQDYCRSRLFDAADDDQAERHRAAERQKQRMEEAAQLQAQSKTLTGMVDELILSRAGTDPHLARLLAAMGLRVDPDSGSVQTTRIADPAAAAGDRRAAPAPPLEQTNERFAPASVQLVGRQDAHVPSAFPVQGRDVLQPPSRSPHHTPQTAVLLLDSDDESNLLPPPSPEGQPPATPQPAKPATAGNVAERIAVSLAAKPYARFRPGGSPGNAVEVDSDASQ